MTTKHLSDTSFSSLPLAKPIADGIIEMGFEKCTPIQAATLPIALAGDDVAGQAQTGTGKTAAFLVALFNRLIKEPARPQRRANDPRAVILAPTRELAVQIHRDAEALGQFTGMRMGLAYGGKDYEKQRRFLEDGVDLLIGTPGRLIDYFKQRVFGLGAVEVMVIDEADRMFDLGFIRDIRYVMRRLPPPVERLSMLFSATLSQRVLELAYEHMNEPELIRIEPDKVTADRIRQVIYFPSNYEKIPLLVGLLKRMDPTRTMVFVNTKRAAEAVQRYLSANGVDAAAISGDVPQRKRERMLHDFQSGTLPVLIGTDVASRGLHIENVSHIFNFDLPQDVEDYVHRIGRTARAGAEGDAISFGCEDYVQTLPDIEKFVGYKIPTASIDPELLPKLKRPPPRPRRKPDARASHGKRAGKRRPHRRRQG